MPGRELKEPRRVAVEFGMTPEETRGFLEYLHDCKAGGDRGTKNDKGDFTRDELREKAREFLGL